MQSFTWEGRRSLHSDASSAVPELYGPAKPYMVSMVLMVSMVEKKPWALVASSCGRLPVRPWAVQQDHAICSREVYISQQSKTNFHGASSDHVVRSAHRELAFVRPKLKDSGGQYQSTVRWRWYSQDWAWAGRESTGKRHGPHHPCPSATPSAHTDICRDSRPTS